MTRRIRFRPQAEDEVLQAQLWYEERKPGLGTEFGTSLSDTISRIADNPLAFPVARVETRRAVLRRFPYAVYFRLLDDDVIVLAVHGSQHPRRWQDRT